MTPILMFVVFPLVTIILAAALESVFNNRFATTAIIFIIFFVLSFTAYTSDFLLNTIIYTIIAFIVASIVRFIIYNLYCSYRLNHTATTVASASPNVLTPALSSPVVSTPIVRSRISPIVSSASINPDPSVRARNRVSECADDENNIDATNRLNSISTNNSINRYNCRFCRGRR